MKTLIMNNSVVMEMKTPAGNELETALTEIIAQRCEGIALSSGTRIDVVFEAEVGAARFGFSSGDEFLLEALVLCNGQGRHCWADFRSWCEHVITAGRARGQNPPPAVPDENDWNCVIAYDACLQLDKEDLGELVKFQNQLAAAYVWRLDQTLTTEEELHL
jgi:hypothetical protein